MFTRRYLGFHLHASVC